MKWRQADFDVIVASAELGIAKPDPKIYHYTAERLGVKPIDCIFVDDQGRYCAAAETAGMKAVIYENFTDFKSELETILSHTKN